MKEQRTILFLLLCALSGGAAQDSFTRYQIIIDKQPFGKEAPDDEVVHIALNQSFARNLRLTLLSQGPNGDLRAGIIDTSRKKSYILKIGEMEDGLEFIEADVSAEEAMLRKDNEVALFKLEPGPPEPLSKKQVASRKLTYSDSRKVVKSAQQPTAPRLSGEALKQHLEQVQMNAIRDGLPPLPLPLTPEMDAQLVAEGVLDPQ